MKQAQKSANSMFWSRSILYAVSILAAGMTLWLINVFMPVNAAPMGAAPSLLEIPNAGLSITKTAHLASAFTGGAVCEGPTFPTVLTTPVQPSTAIKFCYRVHNTSANTYTAFTLSDPNYSEVKNGLTFAPIASYISPQPHST